MVALYIVSANAAAGKTAVCAGLARHLQASGKKVGYIKISAGSSPDGASRDTAFLKQILSEDEASLVAAEPGGMAAALKEACGRAAGKDVVLVEGVLGPAGDDPLSQASYQAARAVDASVIALETAAGLATRFTNPYKGFGAAFLGIIVNKVPRSRLESYHDKYRSQLDALGVKLLGVLPESRGLVSLTVEELAGAVQGKLTGAADKSAALLENLMLGAMSVDSGLLYYGRIKDKAAVLRSDRPDMQLAALETPTRCLVLCGDNPPIRSVLFKAEHRGVPVVITGLGVSEVVGKIEEALEKSRFNQAAKLAKLEEIMPHLDLHELDSRLGTAG
ncbi:MAG: phosphotransacetylase family protein [Chloroflexi bacterium]|nr:phosphotransacetylase family protein [Chloroflexota bacterium]